MTEPRIIIVSNRLPVTVAHVDGGIDIRPSSGGLITAMRAVVSDHHASWIGWTGTDGEVKREWLAPAAAGMNCDLFPVVLTSEQVAKFYFGFSNEIIWPLFHDLQSSCNFDPSYWNTYVDVNETYANVVSKIAQPEDIIWVHDYHLALVASSLRRRGIRARIAFFQHIPFPSLDIFSKLPWRKQVLEALLEHDLIGFQTPRDSRNFVQCCRALTAVKAGRDGDAFYMHRPGQRSNVVTEPIGIDFEEFANHAASTGVLQETHLLRAALPGMRIVLGVDRLDYTKGIPERLRAFENLLENHPELHRTIVLVQIVVPSREDVPRYRDLRLEIEQLVSRINGRFTHTGWVPIHFVYRSLERAQLVAHYRAADVALVTPLKDGMNLVAKEFCAAQVDCTGVLVLSEFAGAASQMKEALLVNPNDIQGVAESLYLALMLDPRERRRRMQRLRRTVRRENVHRWSESFLAQLKPDLSNRKLQPIGLPEDPSRLVIAV